MLSRKRELATADMNSHGYSDGYSRICLWAIHMMSFDVIDLLIYLNVPLSSTRDGGKSTGGRAGAKGGRFLLGIRLSPMASKMA